MSNKNVAIRIGLLTALIAFAVIAAFAVVSSAQPVHAVSLSPCSHPQIVQVWIPDEERDISNDQYPQTSSDLMWFSIECDALDQPTGSVVEPNYGPSTFQCSVDGGPPKICDSPKYTLFNHDYPGNQHTLTVKPTDPSTGQPLDESEAITFTWTYTGAVPTITSSSGTGDSGSSSGTGDSGSSSGTGDSGSSAAFEIGSQIIHDNGCANLNLASNLNVGATHERFDSSCGMWMSAP